MSGILFIDLNKNTVSCDINTFFPDWQEKDERVCIFSPHDDDAIIGAGYAIQAAIQNNVEVFIFIFCRGNAGYSSADQKYKIEKIREEETVNAYGRLGIKKEKILRFNYSDFSVIQNIGWDLNTGKEGSFKNVITRLRQFKITRVLVPNGYREHIDHLAVNIIGSYDSPQAGDPILVDWCEPHEVKSVFEYSVWADLSPEDALVSGRNLGLRANKLITVPENIEKKICEGIAEYESQGEIIKGLIQERQERRTKNGNYVEVYREFDPRPKMNFEPYLNYLQRLDKSI